MRVLIDPQIFQLQRRGGVSRLFSSLATEIEAAGAADVVLPFRYTLNEQVALDFPSRMRLVKPRGWWQTRVLQAANRARRPQLRGVDVVHHTWYGREFIDRYRTQARVSTVFDMIPEVLPEVSGGDPHAGKREFLEASDAIVCISHTTKADLLKVWGDFGKPVHVTHLGVEEQFFDPAPASVALPDDYVLFVGKRANYKNFQLLADAFVQVAGEQPGLHLVAVGGGPFTAEESAHLERHGVLERCHQLDVSEADLPGVYAAARLFVFASRYEGFGLPVVEAYATRCPLVIADTPCLREVAGDEAEIVSPDDPAELADVLRASAEPDVERDARVERGLARAREFTWARTAQQTLEVYRQVTS